MAKWIKITITIKCSMLRRLILMKIKSGHEYISGMVLLVKIKTASRTHED